MNEPPCVSPCLRLFECVCVCGNNTKQLDPSLTPSFLAFIVDPDSVSGRPLITTLYSLYHFIFLAVEAIETQSGTKDSRKFRGTPSLSHDATSTPAMSLQKERKTNTCSMLLQDDSDFFISRNRKIFRFKNFSVCRCPSALN